MIVKKKFQKVGGTKMIIVPVAWIKAEQDRNGKKMIGVYMNIDEELVLTPMWEEKGN